MSVVDDGKTDLEAHPELREWAQRVLPPDEDDAQVARRENVERLRRGLIWYAAVMALALMVGLMLGRVINGPPPPLFAPSAPQLLGVVAEQDGQHVQLLLRLDRAISYRRSEEDGAVSIVLPGAQLQGSPQQGRVQAQGRSLSWRVAVQGDDVQVLLVGLAGPLTVHDQLQPAGEQWLLRLEVPLAEASAPAAQGRAQ